MTRKATARGTWYLALAGVAALILLIGLMSQQWYGTPLDWLIRGTALLGYLAIFLATVSSAYMKQMYLTFGRPFIKVHHILSVTGLILITLHPLGVAVNAASLNVFLPRLDSWSVFLDLAGRPAWYLVIAASLAAVLRKTIGSNWRSLHFLNYLAFWLGTVHAIRIGTDLQLPTVKAVAITLAFVTAAIFVQKRLSKRR